MAGAVLLVLAISASRARGETTIVGENPLVPATQWFADERGLEVPEFQGQSSGGYVLSSPHSGTVVSWSFLSAGIERGRRFALRVLEPVAGQPDSWRAVATSAPAAITTASFANAINGPFATALPIGVGDVVALEPLDTGETPVEAGEPGVDGVRYFTSRFADGQTATLAPGSEGDVGEVVPVQATVSYTPPATETPQLIAHTALAHVSAPTISGIAAAGATLSCDPGIWNLPAGYSYRWVLRSTDRLTVPTATRHGSIPTLSKTVRTEPFSQDIGTGQSLIVPDYPPLGTTIGCEVLASAGGEEVLASSAAIAMQASKPVLRPITVGHPIDPTPHIDPSVGGAGTNRCTTGDWEHDPTSYTFQWYLVVNGGPQRRGHADLIASGQRLRIPEYDEGRELDCVVTASNAAGQTRATSNHYVVPAAAPVAIQGPAVQVKAVNQDFEGLVYPSDPQPDLVAEDITARCGVGRWNRSDLHFKVSWLIVENGSERWDPDYEPWFQVNGPDLPLALGPGSADENFSGYALCSVVATTRHGLSSEAVSARFDISSPCRSELFHDGYEDFLEELFSPANYKRVRSQGPGCGNYDRYWESKGLHAELWNEENEYFPGTPTTD